MQTNSMLEEKLIEIWKPVQNAESFFEVSSKGNVRSINRFLIDTKGRKFFKKSLMLIKHVDRKGYLYVNLRINTLLKKKKVHRLVAEAFIENPENKPQVNHINGIKTDNKVENLEWVTSKENIRHSILKNLTKNKGEDNNKAKLSKEKVLKIRELKKEMSITQLALLFNVHHSTIGSIINYKTWKHI